MSVMCALFVCFWFGILGLLFCIVEVVKMGLQEVRLAIVTVSFFYFLLFYLFSSHKSWFVDLFVLFDFCSFGLWFVFWVLISLCVLRFDFSWVWVGYDFSVHSLGWFLIGMGWLWFLCSLGWFLMGMGCFDFSVLWLILMGLGWFWFLCSLVYFSWIWVLIS